MHIKVHFVTNREFFHQPPQLLKSIEQLDPATSIEVIRLYQPYICSLIHLIINIVFPGDHAFIFAVCLYKFVLLYEFIYLNYLRIIIHSLFCLSNSLYTVEILTEFVNLRYEVFGREVQDKLNRQVLKDIYLIVLTELIHIHKYLILSCQNIVPFEMINDFPLAMRT
jgi:hypothetical protein